MTCANASSTLPFGAIDTPTQGGLASGAYFRQLRMGAVSDEPRRFLPSGGTVIVQVDGVTRGQPGGWTARPESHGALPRVPGHQQRRARGFGLNTTSLTNGLHTIQWVGDRQHGPRRRDRESVLHGVERRGAMTAAGP